MRVTGAKRRRHEDGALFLPNRLRGMLDTLEFTLTPAQAALLPDERDIAFYEANGYWVSPAGVVSDAAIDLALRGAERLWRGEVDTPLPVAGGCSRSTIVDATTPRNDEFVSLQLAEFAEFVRQPLIGAIAARLTRSDCIRLLDDQLVWKPSLPNRPDATVTGWHADAAYWSTCSSARLTTAWIPLHDVAPDNGPLLVLPGSHRWTGLQDLRHFNVTDLATVPARFRSAGRDVEPVAMTLRRGQVSFHHAWTVHAARPNTAGRPRVSMAIHLQAGDNRYRPFTTADGREIHIFDERLCRRTPAGDPDFTDPAVFPVLWEGAR